MKLNKHTAQEAWLHSVTHYKQTTIQDGAELCCFINPMNTSSLYHQPNRIQPLFCSAKALQPTGTPFRIQRFSSMTVAKNSTITVEQTAFVSKYRAPPNPMDLQRFHQLNMAFLLASSGQNYEQSWRTSIYKQAQKRRNHETTHWSKLPPNYRLMHITLYTYILL